ncbi:Aryl-alcohol dehydrogenase [Emericellopsis cladophorae]|uniref:Aryl-alcohol dehydrogenase n=1 Tax=Emericellopsis cladophorae TaxID=2686198 RepID=A0A9P9XWX9_9HYPO|nr:Aryl-alcohol dehydrogenase [Emericellopsis cladophorae]KAI6779245.1 Aryl-alcohol dehydrogenase [Emericellopsis cladophorae]
MASRFKSNLSDMSHNSISQGLALVAHGPLSKGQWKLGSVQSRELLDDEVLVRVIASGICLADVHIGDAPAALGDNLSSPVYYPRVLGHEGSGYVEKTGSSVSQLSVGDPVLLSFTSCGACYACEDNHPAHCADMFRLNFVADREVYQSEGSDRCDIGGSFFGQSSFASRAVVKARCLVNLRGVVESDEELKYLGPLGCGVQTGSAAMLNIGAVKAGQDVAIIGVGSVGLSAIMLAKTLGATHTVNTSEESTDLTAEVRRITDGRGVHVSLDTTGVRALARASYDFACNGGKIIPVGMSAPTDTWDIPMLDLMNSGKQILGCVQGDVVPQQYALDMIAWKRKGVFPYEKIMKFYNVSDFSKALEDMRLGEVVKPVLVWP